MAEDLGEHDFDDVKIKYPKYDEMDLDELKNTHDELIRELEKTCDTTKDITLDAKTNKISELSKEIEYINN